VSNTYLVGVRGESHNNNDGSSRQEIIKDLRKGQILTLVADPLNQYDRYAVGVFTSEGKQIGFLPSDARDSSTVLRGEPISVRVHRLTGGINWFSRVLGGKKYIGVILKIEKPEPDWDRFNKLRDLAEKIDNKVNAAQAVEKSGDIDTAIAAYKALVDEIYKFTADDKYASAHRYQPAPINRLSLLLEKQKKYTEAITFIEKYLNTYDPVQPDKSERENILKRHERLLEKIGK
jgi:tetratricopeptide (TPR) repeat protein